MRYLKLCVLLTVLGMSVLALAAGQDDPMPPNPEKIAITLMKQGVIPANATPEQKDAAVQKYLQLKLAGGSQDKDYNPLARKRLDRNEKALIGTPGVMHGRKLGSTTKIDKSTPQFKPLAGTDKLLLILVEFSNEPYTWMPSGGASRTEAGPLHNQIPVPDNSFDLYVNDFDRQHYEDMLFTPGGWVFPEGSPRYAGEHRGSMRDYFIEQSYGQYAITGQAYGWFMVDKPEAYYGDDSPSGGHDNLSPGTRRALIADVVNVINAQNAITWADYDANGDCLVDHPLFIHAGVDQSGGGGAQGSDALWAHSSSYLLKVADAKRPGAVCFAGLPDGTYLYNYTMMPEDGGVGVFAHEFGHDLGLPDEYDTAYSGAGDSVAFWSVMSSGSWVGKPAQTQPSDMSIWGRYVLGWVSAADNLTVITTNSLPSTPIRLEQAERWGGTNTNNAIRLNIPPKEKPINTPYSGSWEWFGGKADLIDTTLVRQLDLTGKTTASLSFWTWYNIELNWDFGFVQISTDGGATWTSLAINGTTSVIDPAGHPSIAANLPGFTGSSGGWLHKTYDLSAYAGQIIKLQFRYMTDWGTTMDGFYVDDISVTADGATQFLDNVETADSAWTATGWARDKGTVYTDHYYMLEWRNAKVMETPYGTGGVSIVNFDAGLSNVYQFDPYASNPNEPAYFSYATPGLLLWYRDYTYKDNWTGAHPGGGYLLVIDAHKQPVMTPASPTTGLRALWGARVQTYDSTFGLTPPPSTTLGYYGLTITDPGLNAVPNFDDSHSYWNPVTPYESAQTIRYGLLFRVLGQASDGSAAAIGFGLK